MFLPVRAICHTFLLFHEKFLKNLSECAILYIIMAVVKVFSYAKLNLSLNITGIENGYHTLDSLVTSLDLSDEIVLKPRKDRLIRLFMKGLGSESIPLEKNVALIAGERFVEKYQTTGADITIYKNIPLGAGLGGSSADAAGVLRGMAKLYKIDDSQGIFDLANTLGSDTAYMLKGGFARMTGRGDRVEPIATTAKLWFLLVCPPTPVSTKECFAEYDKAPDERFGDTEACVTALLDGDIAGLGKGCYNALYAPARRLNPDVERAVTALKNFSPLGYGMSGSGSSAFALFENREFCEWAKSRYRGNAKCYVLPSLRADEIEDRERIKWRNPFVLSQEEIDGVNE